MEDWIGVDGNSLKRPNRLRQNPGARVNPRSSTKPLRPGMTLTTEPSGYPTWSTASRMKRRANSTVAGRANDRGVFQTGI